LFNSNDKQSHTWRNKTKILGSKLVEETIGVDRTKGEVEEGSTIKENIAHIVIK